MTFDYKKQIHEIMDNFKDMMEEPHVKGEELQQLIEDNKEDFADIALAHMLDVYGEEILT
ncbi:MAG: hypothetical protein R3267_11880 [Paenisporosarcina sp.]|nr:hypothetical protein [Paenisporosarcina sp.]